jgi:hypothetical protein
LQKVAGNFYFFEGILQKEVTMKFLTASPHSGQEKTILLF